jgi:hypothetical protein
MGNFWGRVDCDGFGVALPEACFERGQFHGFDIRDHSDMLSVRFR